MDRPGKTEDKVSEKSNIFIYSGCEEPKTGSLLKRSWLGYVIGPLAPLSLLIPSRHPPLCLPAIPRTGGYPLGEPALAFPPYVLQADVSTSL